MKKLTVFFVLCLTMILLVGCKDVTTLTTEITTEEVTITQIDTTDGVYNELLDLITEFFLSETSYAGTEYSSNLEITMLSGTEVMESIISRIDISRDLINPYFFTTISMDQTVVSEVAIEYSDNQILQYSEVENLIYTDVLERTAQEEEYDEYISDQSMLIYDSIFPGFGNYYKISDSHYKAFINLGTMLRSNTLFVEEGLSLEGLSDGLEDVFMEVNYFFGVNSLTIDIDIDPFAFITGSNVNAELHMSNTIIYYEEFTRVEVDYVNKYVTGPSLRDFGIFTYHDDIQELLYLYPERNNYFRFYFEEGTYNITDPEYVFSIYVYDEDFIEIEGSNEFIIIESGYYFVNIYNSLDTELYIEPDIYKIN